MALNWITWLVTTVALWLSLLTPTRAEIKVLSPASLTGGTFANISYSLARFGEVDYRSNLIYQVFLPSEIQACSFMDHVAESAHKTALLIDRGGCSFSKKSANTFTAGADLAIVVKRPEDPEGDNFIPVPDGKLTKFNSPMIVIDYKVGQRLKEELQKNEQVLLMIDFDAYHRVEKPKVAYWTYPGSRESYAGLLRLKPFLDAFMQRDLISFDVALLFPTNYYAIVHKSIEDPKCYGDGKYCSIGQIDTPRTVTNDTDLLDEGARQRCMWLNHRLYFWAYLAEYMRICLDPIEQVEPIDIPVCRSSVQDAVAAKIQETKEIEKRIAACVNSGFENPEDKIKSAAKIFDEQFGGVRNPMDTFDIVPALVIEDYIVRGEMTITSMASSICDSMLTPPKDICKNLQEFLSNAWQKSHNQTAPWAQARTTSSNINWALLFMACSVLVIGLVLIYVCAVLARRVLNKNMNVHLNLEVQRNVESYMRMRHDGSSRIDTSTAIDV